MKKLTIICLVLTFFLACKNAPDNTPSAVEQSQRKTVDISNEPFNAVDTQYITDLASSTEVVHDFTNGTKTSHVRITIM